MEPWCRAAGTHRHASRSKQAVVQRQAAGTQHGEAGRCADERAQPAAAPGRLTRRSTRHQTLLQHVSAGWHQPCYVANDGGRAHFDRRPHVGSGPHMLCTADTHRSMLTRAPRLQGGISPATRPMTGAGRPLTGFARPGTGSNRPGTGGVEAAFQGGRPGTSRPITSGGRCAGVWAKTSACPPPHNP